MESRKPPSGTPAEWPHSAPQRHLPVVGANCFDNVRIQVVALLHRVEQVLCPGGLVHLGPLVS